MRRPGDFALTDADGESVDDDLLRDRLRRVSLFTGNPYFDASWVGHAHWPSEQVEKERRRQVVILGRYGRQPYWQWEDVDVDELREYFSELMEVISQENALSNRAEDV